ncbi:hypothetical protein [Actinoplanes sp. DH11]|uniref:hypothetical protein n=1 Tax=Actinoplanes sp. DH11 TaxID=2857011 RepID=UPI001E3F73DA|nr:hypothetical protein [Actinoplanes sp. DH11]
MRRSVASAVVAGALLAGVVVASPAAYAATKHTAKGNCYRGVVDQSSITVTWEVSADKKRARAISTEWGGTWGLEAWKVVTDQAKGGSLVDKGRKTWSGAPDRARTHEYTMPWAQRSGTKLDVNVSMWINDGAAACNVRIAAP